MALLEFRPEQQVIVMAKSIGPADDPGAGPAAQVDQPVQTGFNVDAFDGLKKILKKILQFQGQCYKTFDDAPV